MGSAKQFLLKINYMRSTSTTKPECGISQVHGHNGRVLTIGSGDWGSIPGRSYQRLEKMVLVASLFNNQH